MLPTSTSGTSLRQPLVDDLGQRDGQHVEDQPSAERDHEKQAEQHDRKPRRQRHRRLRFARSWRDGGRPASATDKQRRSRSQTSAGARKAARQPSQDASAALMPAASETPRLPHTPLKASVRPRAPDASISIGHADRMIDGGEHAEREHARPRASSRFGASRDADQRDAAADIERRHHVAAAPAIGEPAGRQRENAEGNEGRARQRDQFAVGPLVDDLAARSRPSDRSAARSDRARAPN